MNTTQRVRIGDLLQLHREPTEIDPLREYVAVGIRSFGKGMFYYPPCPGCELSKLRYFRFPVNSLAISNIKAWEGAVAVADGSIDAVASNRFLFYQPVRNSIDIRYIRYYFLTEHGLAQIGKASPGSADRNRTLSMRSFENIEVDLPDIDEQRRIAAILDVAFENARLIAGRRKHTAAHLAALRDQVFGKIRRRRPLGEALEQAPAAVKVLPAAHLPIAGIYSFGRGLINRGEILGHETSYQQMTRLSTGQLVMSKLNAWEGALAVVPEEFDGYHVSPEYPVFEINNSTADAQYIDYLVRWPATWLRLAPRGSMVRRKRTNPSTLMQLEVPFPDLDDQRRIADKLARLDEIQHLASQQEARLATFRPSLLSAAFSGQFSGQL